MKVDKLPSARLSRKIGRLDGREGLPDLQTEKPHSPFLEELATTGEQHFAKTTEDLNVARVGLVNKNGELAAKKSELLQSQVDVEKDIIITENVNSSLYEEYLGADTQSQASKITDRRFLSGAFYYPIILVTIIGELVITYPAFESLFGDSQIIAILTTFAASAMTISYAYILGLVLKRNDDKKRLLQRWVLPTVLSCGVFILGLIVSLSHLRAKKFTTDDGAVANEDLGAQGSSILPEITSEDLVPDSSALIEDSLESSSLIVQQVYDAALTYPWALALFIFLQLALVVVATLGEYFHYSYLRGEQKRIQKLLNNLRSKREKIINQMSQITAILESTNQRDKQLILEHSAQILNINKKVESRAQAFWGTNIRQRADSPNAKSRRFEAPELKNPDWFSEE